MGGKKWPWAARKFVRVVTSGVVNRGTGLIWGSSKSSVKKRTGFRVPALLVTKYEIASSGVAETGTLLRPMVAMTKRCPDDSRGILRAILRRPGASTLFQVLPDEVEAVEDEDEDRAEPARGETGG